MKPTKDERTALLILTALQVANMIDVVIMMPLAPLLTRSLNVSGFEIGVIISSYTVSAGLAGFLSAFFIGMTERKSFLLIVCFGFFIGNLACAASNSYEAIVVSRFVTGFFGGVILGTIWTILCDIVPEHRRGKAIGQISTSFSIASVLGIPIGIYIANIWAWEAPFYMLAAISIVIFISILLWFPDIPLSHRHDGGLATLRIFYNANAIKSMLFISLIMGAGFLIVPLLSPYLVKNVHINEVDLTYVYFFGGIATYFSARLTGIWVDAFGRQTVFLWAASASLITVLAITSLPIIPLWAVVLSTSLFMISFNARFVSAMAIATASISAAARPAFMSFSSAFQHIFMGLLSFTGGALIKESPDGSLVNYDEIGMLSVAITALCIGLAMQIKPNTT